MKDKKEMFLTYLKSNVAPVLVDFLSINELDFAVTIPADIDIKELNGHGYHDHNWGETPMNNIIHHWYWGRAQVGQYLIITSTLYGEQQ